MLPVIDGNPWISFHALESGVAWCIGKGGSELKTGDGALFYEQIQSFFA